MASTLPDPAETPTDGLPARAGHGAGRWLDLLVFAVLVIAIVVLVVVGNATAAVLGAAGAFVVGGFAAWRNRGAST